MNEIPVIIPAYEPDERLLVLLEKLHEADMGPIILVNDGSKEAYQDIFARADKIVGETGGRLLLHTENMGKGRALKTAFAYVLENCPEAPGVVTADSDGQHTPESIIRVMDRMRQNPEALVLGVRQFEGGGIPWKSRFGNSLTEKVFAYSSGVHVSDTQTGLRGIPRAFLKGLLDVKGDRFEFETRMLLEAAGTIPIVEVPIETIYDSEENHQTHFKPIRDSLRIYRIFAGRFLKFIFSSLSSSILDLILFSLFCMVFKKKYPGLYAGIATVAARIFSAIYNYTINYKVVFRSREKVAVSGLRYLILAVLQMMCSAVLVTVLVKALPAFPELLPKIAVDTVLFFVSYKIQQKLVFRV